MARVAGVLLGIFSVLTLFFGVFNTGYFIYIDLIQHRGGVNTGGDFYEATVMLMIGAFSGYFAMRWLRTSGGEL